MLFIRYLHYVRKLSFYRIFESFLNINLKYSKMLCTFEALKQPLFIPHFV